MTNMATSNGMGTGSFYGSNQKRKRKSIENMVNERIKKIKKEKIPDSFKSSITGPSTYWKTFFRQQDAFTYAKMIQSDQKLDSECSLLPVMKTFGTITSTVCKLYFDLEYNKEKNPIKYGSKLVDTFIKYVCVWLKNQFNIQCDRSNFVQYIISKLLQHLKPQSSVEDTHTNMDGNNDKQSKEDINLCQKVFNEFDQGELSDLQNTSGRFQRQRSDEDVNTELVKKNGNSGLIVNMKKGVYYQKCYDPECRVLNFKSEEHPLPRQLLPSYFFDGCDDFDFEDDDEDDAEMFNAAVEAEKSFEDQENKKNLDDQACSNVTCNKAESEIT
ncbi:hypothetical protein KUTeg_004494 [Tegillarca granosa]|uniref:DNA-directed primase/polymerase protein n=1 Tax=Tegillarca granosa TaxID=220873 RepID=A0ABQ9FQ75_TEGGR|nr:hypothetical protein KUTeg_004494 [Tegillarca granosa]